MRKNKLIILLSAICTMTLAACNGSGGGGSSNNDEYTVVWKNYNGDILETDTNVTKGTMPSYDGPTPTRPSSEQYSYTFSGWDPSLSPVVSNATYVAQYENVLISSKIIFDLNGGATTSSTAPIYVSSIKTEDFFFNVTKPDYNFRGWSYNGAKVFDQKGNLLFVPEMSETMTFKAIFAQDVYLTIVSNLNDAGTIRGEGTYPYNSQVDVVATTNRGYIFIGWYDYNSDTLLSNQETYSYMMRSEDVTLEARFKYDTYTLTVVSSHPLLGSVMIKGDVSYSETSYRDFDYLSSVSISAYTKTDEYRFLGWFSEVGDLVETNAVYTFAMPYGNYTLYARWDAPSFNVNISKQYENAGTVTGAGPHQYNETVNVNVQSNIGYEFVGIYENNTSISTNTSYSFKMPFESINLEVRWDLTKYTIAYNLNGGTNSSSNPSSYTVETNTITLANPTRTGYTFTGWTDGSGASVTSIQKGSTGNVTLTANWSVNTYAVTVVINNNTLGSVSGTGNYDFGSMVTLNATPTNDNVFKGWYSDSSYLNKVSDNNPYSFTLDTEGLTLYAGFFTKAEERENWNKAHGVTPVYDNDAGTITYGLYPQTVVSDTSLITSLNSLDDSAINITSGYYLYNDEYYYPLTAIPYDSSYIFSNGSTIESGTKYWFKCEPITWRAYSLGDGTYTLLSDKLLDTHRYNEYYSDTKDGHYANNYEYSEIRSWLNEDFYNKAFFLDNDNIQTTTVDNSASTTFSSSNSYACNNTNDNVYMFGYKDCLNSSYGFSTSPSSTNTRYAYATDFAKANGIYVNLNYGTSYYWTRSPDSSNSEFAFRVSFDGNLRSNPVNTLIIGVRPALSLKLL